MRHVITSYCIGIGVMRRSVMAPSTPRGTSITVPVGIGGCGCSTLASTRVRVNSVD